MPLFVDSLLAFGLWFWLVFFVLSAVEIVLIVLERPGIGIIPFVIFALFVWFFYGFRLDLYIWYNWQDAGWIALKYLGIGLGWSFFQMFRITRIASRDFREWFEKFQHRWAKLPEEEKSSELSNCSYLKKEVWENHISDLDQQIANGDIGSEPASIVLANMYMNDTRSKEVVPEYRNHKADIALWTLYWPWSAFWWFLGSFIADVIQWVGRRLRSVYERFCGLVFGRGGASLMRAQKVRRW